MSHDALYEELLSAIVPDLSEVWVLTSVPDCGPTFVVESRDPAEPVRMRLKIIFREKLFDLGPFAFRGLNTAVTPETAWGVGVPVSPGRARIRVKGAVFGQMLGGSTLTMVWNSKSHSPAYLSVFAPAYSDEVAVWGLGRISFSFADYTPSMPAAIAAPAPAAPVEAPAAPVAAPVAQDAECVRTGFVPSQEPQADVFGFGRLAAIAAAIAAHSDHWTFVPDGAKSGGYRIVRRATLGLPPHEGVPRYTLAFRRDEVITPIGYVTAASWPLVTRIEGYRWVATLSDDVSFVSEADRDANEYVADVCVCVTRASGVLTVVCSYGMVRFAIVPGRAAWAQAAAPSQETPAAESAAPSQEAPAAAPSQEEPAAAPSQEAPAAAPSQEEPAADPSQEAPAEAPAEAPSQKAAEVASPIKWSVGDKFLFHPPRSATDMFLVGLDAQANERSRFYLRYWAEKTTEEGPLARAMLEALGLE